MKYDPDKFDPAVDPLPLENWPDDDGRGCVRGLLFALPISALLWAGIIHAVRALLW